MSDYDAKVKPQDLIVPVLAVSFGTYYMWSVWDTPWEAQIYARFLTAGIYIFGLTTIFKILYRIVKWRNLTHAGLWSKLKDFFARHWHSVSLYVAGWMFLTAVYFVGYAAGMALFLLAILFFLGERRKLRLAVISLSVSISAYLLFVVFLNLRLPQGFIF